MKTVLMAMAVVMLLAGCSKDEVNEVLTPEEAQQQAQQQAAFTAGEALFAQYCSSCHKRQGRSDYLKNIPATMLTRRSEQQLMDWIRGSDKHREMPNFRQLSDQERQQLAVYLKAQIYK